MQVIVKLAADAAGGPQPPASLSRAVEPHGLALTALHPGTDDPDLQSYFTAEVQDERAARALIDELSGLDEVDAAYVQPGPALP